MALLPALAQAGSAGNSFQVTATATVTSACTVSGTTLNFGSAIDPLATATPLDANSTLTVQCTNTTSYTVALNAGSNAGGASNFGSRLMKSGSNTLAYQLYLDAGRSSVWGDGTSSSSTSAGTGRGSAPTLTIYGRLPSLASVVPGNRVPLASIHYITEMELSGAELSEASRPHPLRSDGWCTVMISSHVNANRYGGQWRPAPADQRCRCGILSLEA